MAVQAEDSRRDTRVVENATGASPVVSYATL